MRNTKQKTAIFETLKDGGHLSADEIYIRVNKKLKVDLSTVYRNLNSMYERDEIGKLITVDGVAKYCMNINHHGHMVCLKCSRVYEVPCSFCVELHKIAKDMDFDDKEHVINIYGYCKECKEAK